MSTVYRGTYVLSWSQTEADGIRAPGLSLILPGSAWRWTGQAVRVDQPGSVLRLEAAEGGADLQRRAARAVRRLVGAAVALPGWPAPETLPEAPEDGFVLTDGRRTWIATIIPVPDSQARLLMFAGDLPPADQDLWVVRCDIALQPQTRQPEPEGGVICFTPGTMISTPRGPCPIEMLRPGDSILTADNGPQPVLWMGQRRVTGARLYVMPHLRPIRIRAAALGGGRPDVDLHVSPHHRMLLRGRAADALFGTPEVLVRACDLVDRHGISVDTAVREVTYVHVLLESHQVVFANGVETESFHPHGAGLDTLDPVQREALATVLPDPARYGGFARRPLSVSEAAILRHEAA